MRIVAGEQGLSFEVVQDRIQERLRVLLPKVYEGRCEPVQPVSMGSAGLRYGDDGRVAWDTIWQTFCDLAMAGGPPHRGTLLEPGTHAEIDAEPDRYQEAVAEICRGVGMVTGLGVVASKHPGWVRLYCTSAGMAGWMARALVMENVSARHEGLVVYLPAGPGYRVEKEIKNVVTATAKTCHYWMEHTPEEQKWEIARLLGEMDRESALLQPVYAGEELIARIAEGIAGLTGLRCVGGEGAGWIGVECGEVPLAIRMMRALVASNVLSRREVTLVFVPVDVVRDPTGERIVRAFARAYEWMGSKG